MHAALKMDHRGLRGTPGGTPTGVGNSLGFGTTPFGVTHAAYGTRDDENGHDKALANVSHGAEVAVGFLADPTR